MNIGLISACSTNPPDGYVQQFFDLYVFSAKKMGFEPIIIEKEWVYLLGTKLKIYREFLNNNNNNWDIVICCDAYDIIFQSNKNDILKNFLALNKSIIFSAEINCYPGYNKNKYPSSPTPYAYLNSGFIIGYYTYMKNMFNMFLDDIIEKMYISHTDQGICDDYYLNNMDIVGLDYYQTICQNMFLADSHIKYDNGVFKNIITNSIPCIFHGNAGKEKLLPIIDTLYPEVPRFKRPLRAEGLKY